MAQSMDDFEEVETVDWQESFYEWVPQHAQSLITLLVTLCRRVTLLNAVIFLMKYVPTSIYVYKLMKDAYVKTREKMNRNKAAIEEIQSQIVQLNKKIGVRNSEILERSAEVKRAAERLRRVRSQVKEVIESDEDLKALRDRATNPDETVDGGATAKTQEHEEEKDFIGGLMKEFNCKRMKDEQCDMGGGEPPNQISPENSVYCSMSGADDANKECTIKLIKVTNVYKVAYLRNIVKQKQLIRANKKALLDEKMSSIKKLLDDWQKTLETVTKEKTNERVDQEGQDQRGDISRTNSDSDLKTDEVDLEDNEINDHWSHDPSPYPCGYDAFLEKRAKECYDPALYVNRTSNGVTCNDCRNKLFCLSILPEETSSQMEIDSNKHDSEKGD